MSDDVSVELAWPSEGKRELGGKADGLVRLPPSWTPPFAVGTVDTGGVLERSSGDVRRLEQEIVLSRAFEDAVWRLALPEEPLIVRSSALTEDLDARGAYISDVVAGAASVRLGIAKVLMHAAELAEHQQERFSIVVQRFARPMLSGHLANTRRVSRQRREWMLEYDEADGRPAQTARLRVNGQRADMSGLPSCRNEDELAAALRTVASHFTAFTDRMHCEWIWDGRSLFVVQADIEEIPSLPRPGAARVRGLAPLAAPLSCMRPHAEVRKAWPKVECVRMFARLGLPHGQIYVLDDPAVISALMNGECTPELNRDLDLFFTAPTVIRTDRDPSFDIQGMLLPRSEGNLSPDGARRFMTETSAQIRDAGVGADGLAFICHRFLPASASAWSLAYPDHATVRIDVTWGLPDGLQFYPHDSYEVKDDGSVLLRRLRCKERIIDFDEDGAFISRRTGRPWDWKPAVDDRELATIAEFSRRIARDVGGGVETMFFVRIPPEAGGVDVLPWFCTQEVPALDQYERTESHFSASTVKVRNRAELQAFLGQAALNASWAQRVALRIEPTADVVRDTAFFKEIAQAARDTGCHIELQGSILSHAFFILQREGVPIRSVEPMEERPSRTSYNKLVRDRIPQQIEERGEEVRSETVSQDRTKRLLLAKFAEELGEVRGATSLTDLEGELADLVELIAGYADLNKTSLDAVLERREGKREERGGFETGTVLLETRVNPVTTVARSGESQGEPMIGRALDVARARVLPSENNSVTHLAIPHASIFGALDRDAALVQLPNGGVAEVRYYADRVEVLVWTERGPRVHPGQLAIDLDS